MLSYRYKYIIPLHYKVLHSFADNPSHNVPQALAIASELSISLQRWSDIDNWHAECDLYKYISNTKHHKITQLINTWYGMGDAQCNSARS